MSDQFFSMRVASRYTFVEISGEQVQERERVAANSEALDRFLAGVEKAAYRTAEIATRNPDDALDIVQDAMIKLVEKYASKPPEEWRPLFFTILHSRITDYHRRRTLTGRLFSWFSNGDGPDETDQQESLEGPVELLDESLTRERLVEALQALPTRQQQVFLLRTWQGFNVAETARILNLSEGSIKTHLSRATDALIRAVNQDENPGSGHE